MSTTIHQTKSYIYIYRTTIILNTHAVLYFLTQRTQRTQSFDYADGRGVAETRSGWNIRAKQSMSLRNLF